jgi:hypothetical protein
MKPRTKNILASLLFIVTVCLIPPGCAQLGEYTAIVCNTLDTVCMYKEMLCAVHFQIENVQAAKANNLLLGASVEQAGALKSLDEQEAVLREREKEIRAILETLLIRAANEVQPVGE